MLGRLGWVRVSSFWSDDPSSDLRRAIQEAKRALELDDKLDIAHLTLGVLLAIAGNPEDGMDSVDTAIALNGNNPQCYHAKSMVCLYQTAPDGVAMKESARTALRLSPRDPRMTIYHFFSGLGEAIANGYRPTERSVAELEASCRHQNALWFAFMICAISHVRMGNTVRGKKYLEEALVRFPTLSLAKYASWAAFPIWPTWIEADRKALEVLVTLGLPRE